MDLVEREAALQTLRGRLGEAASCGHVALVAGEAGVGKTSLLKTLAAALPSVWWGACDALQTPHPLAPLLDMARLGGVGFADRLAGPRPVLFEAVLDELRRAPGPVLVVIEDAHWADDATLDLIKFLGRRIERTHALLVVTFRDDEVVASHPLRGVIGELPAAATTRIELAPLSPAGVRGLARGAHLSTRKRPFGLTGRELQVLALLCQGLRNAEIAQRLCRSVRTVDHHLAAVFAKLRVDSRLAAIQAAQRAGLVAQTGQGSMPK